METAPSPFAQLVIAVVCFVGVFGCSKDEKSGPNTAASASAAPSADMATPPASASAMAATSASAASPMASGSAGGPTPHECPKGSSGGDGTFAKPCEGKGTVRMMDVSWNGKTDDKGPFFKVQNKSTSTILYGKIAVYFYDKSGKQLDVQDASQTPPTKTPFRTCAGNIFSGVMKPQEKAVIQFSCVEKKHVPDGTTAIEAEMQVVGFANDSDKKSDTYWKNTDLTPDVRKKGGGK